MKQNWPRDRPSVRKKRDQKKRNDFPGDKTVLLAASGIVIAAAIVSFAVILLLNKVPAIDARERAMLMDYETVQISLSHDDLSSAQRIAEKMAREFGDWAAVFSSVQAISNSDPLESARRAFATLSQEAIRLADHHTEYLILRCPTDLSRKVR